MGSRQSAVESAVGSSILKHVEHIKVLQWDYRFTYGHIAEARARSSQQSAAAVGSQQ